MSFLRRQVMDYKEQIKRANENNAFMIHNGVRAVELSETAARVEMGGVHAGLMFLMAEAAAGLLVRNDGRTCVTIDSSFRFLRSAGPSESLYAEARVKKRGRTVSFCHSGVYGRDSGKLFAEGDFTFFCAPWGSCEETGGGQNGAKLTSGRKRARMGGN